MKLSAILKYSSITVGVIVTGIILYSHPVLVLIDAIVATTYFASIYLKKKGE